MINKKMSIIEVLRINRDTAPILMDFGMHCLSYGDAAASGAGHCPVERAAALSSSPEFFDSLKRVSARSTATLTSLR